jgi:hypothetical protein
MVGFMILGSLLAQPETEGRVLGLGFSIENSRFSS